MQAAWFCLVAIMLAIYVALDGYDIGAGIVHLLLARNSHLNWHRPSQTNQTTWPIKTMIRLLVK